MIESVSLEPTCCSTLSSFYLFTCIIKTSNGPHTVYTLCFCTIILAHVATCNNCTYLCMVMHPFPPLLPQTRKLVGLHALVWFYCFPENSNSLGYYLKLLVLWDVLHGLHALVWFSCTSSCEWLDVGIIFLKIFLRLVSVLGNILVWFGCMCSYLRFLILATSE